MLKKILIILSLLIVNSYGGEATLEKAQHRLPPVIYSLDIPKVVKPNQTYDFKWTVMGYHDEYDIIINIYDKNNKKIASKQVSSYNETQGAYSWDTIRSTKFFYETQINLNFSGSQELTVRFFASPPNDYINTTFLSCLVPGGLGYKAGDTTGRKILIDGKVDTQLSAPTLITPYNGSTDISSVIFRWNAVYGATDYRIVISQDPNFSGFTDNGRSSSCNGTCFTTITSSRNYTKSSFSLSRHTYYWKVRAYDVNGAGTWSDVYSLTTEDTPINRFILPFSAGQTWRICQGYNTNRITHSGDFIHSFDFSIATNSAIGTYGCNPSTSNSSTNQNIIAPATGTIRHRGNRSTDLFCLSFDNVASNGARSMWIGHMSLSNGAYVGGPITQGEIIGTLNAPATLNGSYAHIHISSYSSTDCTGRSLPFNDVFGGNYNFTSDSSVYQWYGTSVSR